MKVDKTIRSMAQKHGIDKMSAAEVRSVRHDLEAAYLNSILDGVPPFVDKHAQEGDDCHDGEAQSDRGGPHTPDG